MPDCESVKLWRDTFKLNLSASWKRDVEVTVKDLNLWKSILDNWFWIDAKGKKRTKHPGIKGLLDEYDRLATTDSNIEKREREEPLSDSHRPWLSERGQGDVPEVQRHPERLYFGAD